MALGLTLAGCNSPEAQSQFGNKSIDEIIAAMSPEDKANFVIGTNRVSETPPDAPESLKKYPQIHPKFQKDAEKYGVDGWEKFQNFVATYSTKGRVQGAAGQHWANDTLGIPPFVYADGPAGLRIDPKREGDNGEYYCTAFPTETALAATWDLALVEEVTTAMGEETKEYGADILLAPAINIHRNPLCGRNFEYFSEDPYLVGKMAAAYINGIQKNGVGTSLKHFAVNNQETHRNGVNEVVSMRALREIYLKGFEIAVKESQPWTIMSSYNKINGVFASENKWLLEDVLRGEWGYEGFVMTDWWAQENGVRQQLAGNDLLMPGTQRQYEEVLEGIKDGSLPEEVINRNISRILKTMAKSPIAQGYEYSNKPDLKAHAEITHRVACEGMVLLANGQRSKGEGQRAALPLDEKSSVALYGNAAYEILVGGSGSGNVNRKYKVSLLEGMNNAGFAVVDGLAASYKKYIEVEKAKKPAENFWSVPVYDEMVLNERDVDNDLTSADAAIFTICRMAGEGGDRKCVPGDYLLSETEAKNLRLVSKVAHAKKKPLIVVLNMGNIIDMKEVLANEPDAILHAWLGGQEAGNSIADVLSGKVNPSGKLPMTWAMNYEDYASSKNFPFTEGDSVTRYEEDIYVGYRQFDKGDVKPLYPFGFGLSYTTFDYLDIRTNYSSSKKIINIELDVKNTGKVAGKEAVQIYVSAPNADSEVPVKELKAFAKTRILQPGEIATLTFQIPTESLASWLDGGWQLHRGGRYTIHAASNAQDIKLSTKIAF